MVAIAGNYHAIVGATQRVKSAVGEYDMLLPGHDPCLQRRTISVPPGTNQDVAKPLTPSIPVGAGDAASDETIAHGRIPGATPPN